LARLAQDGELFAYKHKGFWHPMDTIRDRDHLSSLCVPDKMPWMTFDQKPSEPAGKAQAEPVAA
jgi:glucose-1-phosphate cytidylyltransferase